MIIYPSAYSYPINLSARASEIINNTIQVFFDSVLGMYHEGMVSMFKALLASGLSEFLGCSSAIYEAALVEFFHNASVRDGMVVSTVQGKPIAILEELFAGKSWLTGADCCLIFQGYAATRQAKGYAVQISVLLKNAPDLELGESKDFPPLKILTAKIVGTYIAKNKNIHVDEDEPAVEKPAEKKKAVSKKRPATTVEATGVKKKRTTVGRAAPVEKEMAMVRVVQDVEPLSPVPAPTPKSQRRRAPKRKLVLPTGSDDEIVDTESDVETIVKQQRANMTADDVDKIIDEVISETAQMETDVEEPSLTISDDTVVEVTKRSTAVNDEDDNLDGAEN
ncbi:pentatricopeptide repeat-containing protein mitochondrial-like [Dorcoceras hygrometricum]|uniref:Pentatricopeptide repeat-containing protein mitochondrial-like n=1 Tax=Dorcoceras hygrometricum TaxID=472368 RepID=A0A2Z7CUS4_9LAMI|nr:pentatricopeptide repeat-containing protein mitochondrial-like [Dorcoceras hygrometricum]